MSKDPETRNSYYNVDFACAWIKENGKINHRTTPFITSGIRIGTPAMTTRGFTEQDFVEVGKIISLALKKSDDKKVTEDLKKKVEKLCANHPIYKEVSYE